jgi:hypothetical protein
MSDQHQVNSIIAAAISDARKDHPDGRIDPEEAKQVAKCIIEDYLAPDFRSCRCAKTELL